MPLTRRTLLQSLSAAAGSFATAPLLRTMEAVTRRPEDAPKRFVFVVKSSGVDKYNLVPKGIENHYLHEKTGKKLGNRGRREGELLDVALADYGLPDKLEALAKFRDRMTVIQSLSGEGFSGNHTSGYGALSCHNSERVAIAPTVDCLLGQHLSTGPYPIYGMALHGRLLEGGPWKPADTYCYPNLSALKKGLPVAFQGSPRKAFMELFGAAVATPAARDKELALHGRLMDFLRQDARRVERKLTDDEKQRFELYAHSFESLRTIEEKKAKLAPRIKQHAPELTAAYDSKDTAQRIACHFDLATATLLAGLTNVITLRPDTLGTKYGSLRLSESVHELGHTGYEKASNGEIGHVAREQVERIHLECIAQMATKLDSVPEGEGTMLDNTMIVYMSCNGGDHHGGQADWPFVLVGGMAGKVRMGRYLEYPKYRAEGHRTIGNLYLSLMQAAGLTTQETFGQLDANLKHLDLTGPLAELAVS